MSVRQLLLRCAGAALVAAAVGACEPDKPDPATADQAPVTADQAPATATAAGAPGAAAAGEAVPVAQLPASKLAAPASQRHPSPDKLAEVLESEEITEGDFPQAPLYLKAGGKVYDLGAYRRVESVTWAADSRSVTIQGAQFKEYGLSDVVRVTYVLGAPTMTREVLRQEKDEPTG